MHLPEKRQYLRSNGLVLVNYKIAKMQMESKSSAFDISGSGVRITVNKKLAAGTLVEMEIYLPGTTQPILAKGTVIWSESHSAGVDIQVGDQQEQQCFHAGIQFTVLSKNNKNRLTNYVQRKLQQYMEKA